MHTIRKNKKIIDGKAAVITSLEARNKVFLYYIIVFNLYLQCYLGYMIDSVNCKILKILFRFFWFRKPRQKADSNLY